MHTAAFTDNNTDNTKSGSIGLMRDLFSQGLRVGLKHGASRFSIHGV